MYAIRSLGYVGSSGMYAPTGPHRGQQRHDQFGRPLQVDGDQAAGTDAEPAQPGGEPARTLVQLRVGEGFGSVGEGDRVRGAGGPLGEQFVRPPLRAAHRGVVPLHGEGVQLLRRHQRAVVDGLCGCRGRDGLQQVHVLAQQPVGRPPVEQRRVVLPVDGVPVLRSVRLDDLQDEFVLALLADGLDVGEGGGVRGDVLVPVLVHEGVAEDRCGAVRGAEAELADERPERVAVGDAVEERLLDLLAQVGEGLPAGHPAPDGHHGDEVAHGDVEARAGAVADRHADQDVVLLGVLAQQHVVRRQERRRRVDAVGTGEPCDPLAQLRREATRHGVAVCAAPGRGARPVGGERGCGQRAGQLLLPVREPGRALLAPQQRRLLGDDSAYPARARGSPGIGRSSAADR